MSKKMYAQVLRELVKRFEAEAPPLMHPARARRILLDIERRMREEPEFTGVIPGGIPPLLLSMDQESLRQGHEVTASQVVSWLTAHRILMEASPSPRPHGQGSAGTTR